MRINKCGLKAHFLQPGSPPTPLPHRIIGSVANLGEEEAAQVMLQGGLKAILDTMENVPKLTIVSPQ